MALLLPVAPVIALERIGPFAAIKRSISLSKRRFWAILWIALLSGVVATSLSLMLPLLPLAIVSIVGFGGEQYVVGASTIAASLLVLPFVAGAAVMAYFDLRVRTEGLDIQSSIGQHFETPWSSPKNFRSPNRRRARCEVWLTTSWNVLNTAKPSR
jgi:hypothetical protein